MQKKATKKTAKKTTRKYSKKSVFPPKGKEKLSVNLDTDASIRLATLAKKCRMFRGKFIEELINEYGEQVEVKPPPHLASHKPKATDKQVGGNHYKDFKIQPIKYIQANNLSYCEANVVKYVTRWRSKNGIEDLKKAKHYIDLLMESEVIEPNLKYLRE